MTTLIAIDPGPEKSAFVVWDGQKILDKGECENLGLRAMLMFINKVQFLAIETIQCFGMPAGEEMFMTMFWVGRFCEAANIPHRLVKRSEVKMHLCGSMRAKDANIRQALIDRFGPPGTKAAPGVLHGVSKHLWSALAIAVTAAETQPETKP